MSETGYSNEATIKAWADIVIQKWKNKIVDLQVWDTGALYRSLLFNLIMGAGDNVERIEFSFALYGVFVDAGHGREISKGNPGDLGFTPDRKPKLWYSRILWAETKNLSEILTDRYSEAAVKMIINSIRINYTS